MSFFPGQRPDETIVMIIRKHVIVYVRLVLFFLVTTIFPAMIFLFFWMPQFPLSNLTQAGLIGYLGVCFFLIFSLAVFLVAWLNESFDLFILTNQRLVDITQVNFFKRTVAATQLRNIEDTLAKVSGFWPTLLNYGDLDVQTAAGDPSEFYMDHIPDPVGVARVILNAVYEGQKKHAEAISQGKEEPDKIVMKGKAT